MRHSPDSRESPESPGRDRARELRRGMSMPERKLWNMIKDRKLDDVKFRRQHPIGPYTTDFYCAEARLIIELDSSWHGGRVAQDRHRDAHMRSLGIATIRIECSYGSPPELVRVRRMIGTHDRDLRFGS